jgi:ATP synthase F1 gamma subunit
MKEAYYGYEYDDGDVDELFANLTEHITANLIFGALVENTACELAARMNSMDNATTNAGKMHYKLNLLYNRTRQANITTELSEIISGAAAVMEAE